MHDRHIIDDVGDGRIVGDLIGYGRVFTAAAVHNAVNCQVLDTDRFIG